MQVYSSQEILDSADLYELQDSFSCCAVPFQYQMTDGEIAWYRFIKDRYSIADWISKNTNGDFLLTFDCPLTLKEVLQSDGSQNKAVMLSDKSALQRLFFWLS